MRGGVALRSTRSQYSWALSRVPDAVQLSTEHRTRVCVLRAGPAGDIETEKLTGSLQQVRKAAFNTITQDPSTAPGRHRRRPALLPCPPRLFRPNTPYRPWSHAQETKKKKKKKKKKGGGNAPSFELSTILYDNNSVNPCRRSLPTWRPLTRHHKITVRE